MISEVETNNYLRIGEVAILLGVSPGAVRIAIHDGRLPSVVDHDVRWVLKEDAVAYKERTQPGGVPLRNRPKGAKDRAPRKKKEEHPDA